MKPVAIIDIGSNSVRLVVYSGATRAPSVLFNEKVMAGLGSGLDATGALSAEAEARALAALARFWLLVGAMDVERTRVFATAAVREASNGALFLDRVRDIGFQPRLLSGEEEARLAALGVIAGIPDADGIVGDLGGGSLELADVKAGEVRGRISLPIGVLRLGASAGGTDQGLLRHARKVIAQAGLADAAAERPLYMVGGSWRALARLDLDFGRHPLPILHQHEMAPDRPRLLQRRIGSLLKRVSKPRGRLPTLPQANLLLRAVVSELRPSRLIASATGVREGLLYGDLSAAERARDPLIEAARDAGAGLGRFAQHGDLIDRWIGPIFDDAPEGARLRLAACLLADIAWAAHPDFRAERGVDMALHGNWVGIDAAGRVLLAAALFAAFGGGVRLPYPAIAALCGEEKLARARQWGLAIRLAQRLSGGVAEPLGRSRLSLQGDAVVLSLIEQEAAIAGEAVERRLRQLAVALDRRPELRFA